MSVQERLFLDFRNSYFLKLTFENGKCCIEFPSPDSLGNPLYNSLKKCLVFTDGSGEWQFSSDKLSVPSNSFEIVLRSNLEIGIASISKGDVRSSYKLSPIECRFFARNGRLLRPSCVPSFRVRTDLHSHFAGCPGAWDLVELGKQLEILYPVKFLEEVGISGFTEDVVNLKDLSERNSNILKQSLEIPLHKQIPFQEMNTIYRLRGPITKNLDAFIPLCRLIAESYAEMGIEYAELSFTDIINEKRLELLRKNLSEIENETGVVLRFLGAIGRRDDPEWDLDYVEKLKDLKDCPFLAGVDFLGHEVNSTRVVEPYLNALAEWADKEKPGYVLRVHAGENPAHPENIKVALETVRGLNVQIRIGHGLYGNDQTTMALLKETRAVVEFNLNSNYALNNIYHCDHLPLKFYLDEGIKAVLGMDGFGIYQTCPESEKRAAVISGITGDHWDKIAETEDWILSCVEKSDYSEWQVPECRPPVHFSDEVLKQNRKLRSERRGAMEAVLEKFEINFLDELEFQKLLSSSKTITIAGAWKKSWDKIDTVWKKKIKDIITDILKTFPDRVFLTGGTVYGLEGLVHECALKAGVKITGILVEDLSRKVIDPKITNAYIAAEHLYGKASFLYHNMQKYEGACIFIGGGNIVGDEIQTAHNLSLNYFLMSGPEGAADQYSCFRPHRSFSNSQEILEALSGEKKWESSEGGYWHIGCNPTVDSIITRKNIESGQSEILLVKRRSDAGTEPGKWALPGGFVFTEAKRDTLWEPGFETFEDACLRELEEETGLDLFALKDELKLFGVYTRRGRDPRDSAERWTEAHAFHLHLTELEALQPVSGDDDVEAACWVDISNLPWNMAFDHADIIGELQKHQDLI